MSNINKTIYDAIKPHVENDSRYKTRKIETLEKTVESFSQQIEWFNSFVDAIQTWDHKLYDRACKYADEVEEGCI